MRTDYIIFCCKANEKNNRINNHKLIYKAV